MNIVDDIKQAEASIIAADNFLERWVQNHPRLALVIGLIAVISAAVWF